uniref:tetratricopeptide repeat protein n=1 Tax=Thaumasiovibrio occultus TaxID=1891184 RepID=UPI00131D8064|nr:tetratricopeptide repeat protein [Thaumasiovibrio occultus]
MALRKAVTAWMRRFAGMVLLSSLSVVAYASSTTLPSNHLADTIDYVELQALEGDKDLQLFLGQAYLYGEHQLPVDLLRSLYWLEMAAEDNPQVQRLLGQLFDNGSGFPADANVAASWYGKAAAGGDRDAMELLGLLYITERLPSESPCGEAINWLEQAADLGSLSSRRNLVWLYSTCSEPQYRDGDKALRMAKQLMQRLPELSSDDLDNLAAAYAACGEFDKAVDTQLKAIATLTEQDVSKRRDYQARLTNYQQGVAWVDR